MLYNSHDATGSKPGTNKPSCSRSEAGPAYFRVLHRDMIPVVELPTASSHPFDRAVASADVEGAAIEHVVLLMSVIEPRFRSTQNLSCSAISVTFDLPILRS